MIYMYGTYGPWLFYDSILYGSSHRSLWPTMAHRCLQGIDHFDQPFPARQSYQIIELVGGLENVYFSHHIGTCSSSQLTKSIIFQRGWNTTNQYQNISSSTASFCGFQVKFQEQTNPSGDSLSIQHSPNPRRNMGYNFPIKDFVVNPLIRCNTPILYEWPWTIYIHIPCFDPST